METKGIDQMVSELRAMSQAAAGKPAAAQGAGGVDFSQVLKSALEEVSQAQQGAQDMAKEFAAGNPNANLQDVMVNLQKANISFQQMVQVRNRLVQAYQDVMNIQV